MVPGFSVTASINPGIRVSICKLFLRVNFNFREIGIVSGRLYLLGIYSIQFPKNGLKPTDYV